MSNSPYLWIRQALVEEPQPTKFPFRATINGTDVTVHPDWIEWPPDPSDPLDMEFEEDGGWSRE